MRKKNLITSLIIVAAMSFAVMTGCDSQISSSGSSVSSSESSESGVSESTSSAKKTTLNESDSKVIASSTGISLDTADLFSNRDLEQTVDTSEATSLSIKDGETLTIDKAGVYIISGSAKDAQIRVEAGDEDKVQLVLDGVSITNTDKPAIYVLNADKCFITTTDSENTLSVTGSFEKDGDTKTDAVIFAKDDLVLNGVGSLSIESTDNGISCKDDLKITGGTYTVKCTSDALEANDSIRISDGNFTIESSKDALHAENDEDDSEGFIYISGGSFTLASKSDGIQGTTYVVIDGGDFTIKSAEGIEATYVQINDGTVDISASDDGINASKKSTQVGTPTVEFTGGDVKITMGNGDVDAVDANGNVIVSGGKIDISVPTQGSAESFDYDGSASFTGGTIIINGEEVSDIPTPRMMGGKGGNRGNQGNFGNKGDMENNGNFQNGGRKGRQNIDDSSANQADRGSDDGNKEMPGFDGQRPGFDGQKPEFDGEMPQMPDFNGENFKGDWSQFDDGRSQIKNKGGKNVVKESESSSSDNTNA